jgi:hypothetical protein
MFEMNIIEATKVMRSYGRGDLLEGMEALDRVWDEHASGSDRFADDSDFYECYEAEVNAYNVVFSQMSQLI